MQFQKLIESITPEIYANLKAAIEIGKWPDGRGLSIEQRELCLQAVIAYELKNIPEDERTGYIDRGSKAEGEVCADDDHHHGDEQPIKWQ